MSKISIIVPVYNTEGYLCKCIDSILNQTYKFFELILVDDGSTDNSLNICKEYEEKDKRIKVFHKENGGQGSARNLGIDKAEGEYIGFVDSDDFIHPRYYEILKKLLDEKNADIACCHYQFIQPDEKWIFEELDYNAILSKAEVITTSEFMENYDRHFRAVSWISPCTKLCKREMFKNTRYPEGVIDEDSYILHHLLGNSDIMVRIEKKLYYYVWSPNSTSRSKFSPRRFDKNGANIDRIEFFEERGIKNQADYFKREYLLDTLKMYYLVKNEHPEFLRAYKPYLDKYKKRLRNCLNNNTYICNMEKLIYNIFAFYPDMAKHLYKKYLL